MNDRKCIPWVPGKLVTSSTKHGQYKFVSEEKAIPHDHVPGTPSEIMVKETDKIIYKLLNGS